MAAELGGMPVSAPGAMSTRTDKQPIRDIPSSYYGEGQELRDIQAAAPMAATPPPSTVELFAPTQRPDEPITSGVDYGPGVGSDALTVNTPDYKQGTSITQTLQKIAAASPQDPRVQSLLQLAQKNGW